MSKYVIISMSGMKQRLSTLTASACFGWSTGIIVGLLDATVRIAHQHFEWFEIYLALLLPALVFCVVFSLIALLVGLLCFALRLQMSPERCRVTNVFVLTVLVLAYGAGAALLRGEGAIRVEDVAGPLILLGAVTVFAIKGSLAACVNRLYSSSVMALVRSTVIFATGFILISLPGDLYNLLTIPQQTPSAPLTSTSTPNVVLITLDTVRADHLSLYGYERATSPALDAFAEGAFVFEDAVSTTSWTLPSHASIFTGQRLHQHQAHTNHQMLSQDALTLAEILSAGGYITAGFVGGPYCKAKYGLGQGFQFYSDRLDYFEWNTTFDRFSVRRLLQFIAPALWDAVFKADGERTAVEINRDIFKWLDKNQAHPFFLFVNYFDAHDPYDLGGDYLGQFTSERRPYSTVDKVLDDIYYGGPRRYAYEKIDEDLLHYMVALYDAEIAYLDHQLDIFLKELKKRKLLKNTIVVVTSDHGEEFFEHGGVLHRQTLYSEVLEVPLVIAVPGSQRSARVSSLVGTIDIFATLLDLLGINQPPGQVSRSLKGAFSGEQLTPGTGVLSELYGNKALGGIDMKALTDEQFRYIDVSTPQERAPDALFDRREDPGEQSNLIAERDEVLRVLKEKLHALHTQGSS